LQSVKIFLVGYMGSGKSTLGKQLANRLQFKFVDLDKTIEEKEGHELFDIFNKQGEAYFRGLEKKYLHETTALLEDAVIAVGGGTPCFYDNMSFMNKEGVTVYLKMDASSLAYRIFNGKGKRPLVDGKSEADLKVFVKDHLAEREDMYNDASIIVEALGFDAKKLDELASRLRAYSK